MPADRSSIQAKRLLHHYLQIGFQNSGYRWNSDNTAEVNEIIDSLIDACVQSTPTTPATPATPTTPDIFRPDWIELPDGGWVRLSEIYLVNIARNGDLILHLRCKNEGISIDADDPLLGVFLDALIYERAPSETDDSYLGS